MTLRQFGSGVRWLVALLAAAGLTGRRGDAQASDSEHLRPTSVTVTIENDRLYGGTYTAAGISIVCGTVTLGFPNRENAFSAQLINDKDGATLSVVGTALGLKVRVKATSSPKS